MCFFFSPGCEAIVEKWNGELVVYMIKFQWFGSRCKTITRSTLGFESVLSVSDIGSSQDTNEFGEKCKYMNIYIHITNSQKKCSNPPKEKTVNSQYFQQQQ